MAENGSWFDHVIHWHEQCMVRKYTTKVICWVNIYFHFFTYSFSLSLANILPSTVRINYSAISSLLFSRFSHSLSHSLILTDTYTRTQSRTLTLTH